MTNFKLASKVQCTVVVVGDARVGKSSIIERYTKGTFSEKYTPTSFEKFFYTQEVNKHEVVFNIWDTSGFSSYDAIRCLSYEEADVFLLCYKISDPLSLYNVKNKWAEEVRRHRPEIPLILCGCHSELRVDSVTSAHLSRMGRRPVSLEQALAICVEIRAVNYIETSAKDKDSSSEAFEIAALAAIRHFHTRRSRKTVSCSRSSSEILNDNIMCTEKRHLERDLQIASLSFSSSSSSSSSAVAATTSSSSSGRSQIGLTRPCSLTLRPENARRHDLSSFSSSFSVLERKFDSVSISSSISSSETPSSVSSNASIRPHSLSQRPSYRSIRKVSIPVASPTSPSIASLSFFELKTPIGEESSEGCEDSILQRSFVCPKSGVYRHSPDGSKKNKQNCLLM